VTNPVELSAVATVTGIMCWTIAPDTSLSGTTLNISLSVLNVVRTDRHMRGPSLLVGITSQHNRWLGNWLKKVVNIGWKRKSKEGKGNCSWTVYTCRGTLRSTHS